jgi:hypothetical protein
MLPLSFALLSTGVFMSARLEPATLDEVLERAELVVVVERVGRADDSRYRVVETLAWKSKGAAPSGELRVFGPNQEFNQMMAKQIKEHGYQGLPAPILPQYSTTLDDKHFATTRRLILFLRPWKSNWQLAMESAWEALSQKERVLSAINNKK